VAHLPKAQLYLLVSSQIQFGTESNASAAWSAGFVPKRFGTKNKILSRSIDCDSSSQSAALFAGFVPNTIWDGEQSKRSLVRYFHPKHGLGRRTKYYLGLLTVTHFHKAQLCLLVSSQIQFGTESKASVVWCATSIPNTVWDEEQTLKFIQVLFLGRGYCAPAHIRRFGDNGLTGHLPEHQRATHFGADAVQKKIAFCFGHNNSLVSQQCLFAHYKAISKGICGGEIEIWWC